MPIDDETRESPGSPKSLTIRVPKRLQRARVVHAALVVVTTPLALVAATLTGLAYGIHASDLALWAGLHLLSFVGVSVGLHRGFCHRAFACGQQLRGTLAILGMAAAQGSLLFWVANHRHHHMTSDTAADPHSPVGRGAGVAGFWRAHAGWMFTHEFANPTVLARDLLSEPALLRLNRAYPLWVALGLLTPAVLGWLVLGGAEGAIRGFVWGGLVRLATVHNATFAINSLCHSSGARPNATGDNSRNVGWLSILSFGESWHNNHHASPGSARFGRRVGEIDLGYLTLLFLRRLGLVWDLRPEPTAIRGA